MSRRVASPRSTLSIVLAAEVRAGLVEMALPQSWLAWKVGASQKHVSEMLTGAVDGSLAMWEAMLVAVDRWPWTPSDEVVRAVTP